MNLLSNKYSLLFLIVVTLIFASCERRLLEEEFYETALLPVKIDWSKSGIPVIDSTGNDLVHRVSLRFFPHDGSKPFEKYLEGNIMNGKVELPIGEYSVIVFNESVHDVYLEDAFRFTDIDNYSKFAATIIETNRDNYPYYTPVAGEKLVVEPYFLSSWSLDTLIVTKEMVQISRFNSRTTSTKVEAEKMLQALSNIKMRHLTYHVNVTAHVQNLVSSQLRQGALRGFAGKVYMASANTEEIPVTYIFKMNNVVWYDNRKIDGTISKSFLSFGRLPQNEKYWFNMDILLVTGEKYDQPLLFDITEKIVDHPKVNINIDLEINFSLPYVEGGVNVGGWDDESIIIN